MKIKMLENTKEDTNYVLTVYANGEKQGYFETFSNGTIFVSENIKDAKVYDNLTTAERSKTQYEQRSDELDIYDKQGHRTKVITYLIHPEESPIKIDNVYFIELVSYNIEIEEI